MLHIGRKVLIVGSGLAHNINQIEGFRLKNFNERFKNIFYSGASTVPETGLSMVIISSKLAVELKLREAFQKVNFLRDIRAGYIDKGRIYFPGVR